MKSFIFKAPIIIGILMLTVSCEDLFNGGSLGGDQSVQGEVGNNFDVTGSIEGVSDITSTVTKLSDGISTISFSASITDENYQTMAAALPGASINGNAISFEEKCRITTEGMESIYDEGKIILVKYDAKVGDTYSLKRGSSTLKREVVSVSSEDDFFWGWMMIKTIDVKETGRNMPGVSNIVYNFNHKFGIVGLRINFEDGTNFITGIYSNN